MGSWPAAVGRPRSLEYRVAGGPGSIRVRWWRTWAAWRAGVYLGPVVACVAAWRAGAYPGPVVAYLAAGQRPSAGPVPWSTEWQAGRGVSGSDGGVRGPPGGPAVSGSGGGVPGRPAGGGPSGRGQYARTHDRGAIIAAGRAGHPGDTQPAARAWLRHRPAHRARRRAGPDLAHPPASRLPVDRPAPGRRADHPRRDRVGPRPAADHLHGHRGGAAGRGTLAG